MLYSGTLNSLAEPNRKTFHQVDFAVHRKHARLPLTISEVLTIAQSLLPAPAKPTGDWCLFMTGNGCIAIHRESMFSCQAAEMNPHPMPLKLLLVWITRPEETSAFGELRYRSRRVSLFTFERSQDVFILIRLTILSALRAHTADLQCFAV
jgi:hypothetical protein